MTPYREVRAFKPPFHLCPWSDGPWGQLQLPPPESNKNKTNVLIHLMTNHFLWSYKATISIHVHESRITNLWLHFEPWSGIVKAVLGWKRYLTLDVSDSLYSNMCNNSELSISNNMPVIFPPRSGNIWLISGNKRSPNICFWSCGLAAANSEAVRAFWPATTIWVGCQIKHDYSKILKRIARTTQNTLTNIKRVKK